MPSILLVEDNAGFRTVVQNGITRTLKHRCKAAGSAREAQALLFEDFFHVVISDISLPDMSGLELLAYIRANHADTQVILISAISDAAHKQGAAQLGAAAFLSKPLELAELYEVIERTLEAAKQSRGESTTRTLLKTGT